LATGSGDFIRNYRLGSADLRCALKKFPFGRVQGIPWLFVADSSLFPNSLEVNPYLTIMALADRVAETIRKDAHALI
jgi:GMC oxidoreductase